MLWGLWEGHSEGLERGAHIVRQAVPVTSAALAEEHVVVLCCQAGNVSCVFVD